MVIFKIYLLNLNRTKTTIRACTKIYLPKRETVFGTLMSSLSAFN